MRKSLQRLTRLKLKTVNLISFEKHLNNICGKTKTKLCVLSQLASFIEYQRKKGPINACSEAQLFEKTPLQYTWYNKG